jgi:SulP family sulfate permease
MTIARLYRPVIADISGAFADAGVLIPLVVALIVSNGLPATGVFFGIGLAYLLSGIVYRLPMPVQPLKAVAAIAIAQGLSPNLVSATGLALGLPLLLLAAADLPRYLTKLFSKPIIRGLQLGVAALLVRSGVLLASRPQMVADGPDKLLQVQSWSLPLGPVVAVAVLIFLFFAPKCRLGSASLPLLFGLGASFAIFSGGAAGLSQVRIGLSLPRFALPRPQDVAQAFFLLALPQLPLTLGNAVFATADTAHAYFGEKAAAVTPRRLLGTSGSFQVLSALFGGVAVCHGSGGLTAHYKLGARSGLAPIVIGSGCLALALLVDGKVLPILELVPYPVLGALMSFVGVQHALLARDLRAWQDVAVAMATAFAGLTSGNLAVGMAVGMAVRGLVVVALRLRLLGQGTSP